MTSPHPADPAARDTVDGAPYAELAAADGAVDSDDVVHFVDRFLLEGIDLDAALAGAAALAHCVVGVSADVTGGHRGFDDLGGMLSSVPEGAANRRLEDGGVLWLARRQGPHPLDAVLLERLAIVAAVTLRHAHAQAQAAGPVALELALSPVAAEVDRSRALRALGIEPTSQLTVLAYDGPIAEASAMLERLRETTLVRVSPVASVHAIVLSAPLPVDVLVPRGARIGVGVRTAALDAATAWRQALTALRYALPSMHGRLADSFVEAMVVPYDQLGAFALLAEHLPVDRIAGNADLAALDRLAGATGGDDLMRTLETVAATESVRRAASHLRLHHNSVAHRVTRAEVELEFSISAPYGRARLLVALVLRRLRDNVERLGPLGG